MFDSIGPACSVKTRKLLNTEKFSEANSREEVLVPNTSASRAKVRSPKIEVHNLSSFLQPHASPRTPNPAAQKAMAEMLKSTLKSAGFDLNKFEKFNKQAEAELRDWAVKRKSHNDAERAAMQKTIAQTIANWRDRVVRLKDYVAPPPSPFKYYLLDTSTGISATPRINLAAQNIAPTQNWAEFQFQTGESDTQEVTFEFSWQNATANYQVINIDGYLVLNGECQALADSGTAGIFPGGSSDVYVYANLYLFETWQPMGSTSRIQADSAQALYLHADGGGWFQAVGAILDQKLFRGFDLQYQTLVIPPGAVLNIQVACSLQCTVDGGSANYIFNTLGRQVLTPGVLVTVVS
jgi:hypothetical protein